MNIHKSSLDDATKISQRMLKDLEFPDKRFPQAMIASLQKHAQLSSIQEEFNNPKLLAFVAKANHSLQGFIVGYLEDDDHAMIHYVTADSTKTKVSLINEFTQSCKQKQLKYIITDTFEFFDNYTQFLKLGFIEFKRESIGPELDMLWLRKDLL